MINKVFLSIFNCVFTIKRDIGGHKQILGQDQILNRVLMLLLTGYFFIKEKKNLNFGHQEKYEMTNAEDQKIQGKKEGEGVQEEKLSHLTDHVAL